MSSTAPAPFASTCAAHLGDFNLAALEEAIENYEQGIGELAPHWEATTEEDCENRNEQGDCTTIVMDPEDGMHECRNAPDEAGVRPPLTKEQIRALLEAAYSRLRPERTTSGDNEVIVLEDSPPRPPRRRLKKRVHETPPKEESEDDEEVDEHGNLAGFVEHDSEDDSEESFDGSAESDAWSDTSEEESGEDEEEEESGEEGSSESGGGESEEEDGVEIVGERIFFQYTLLYDRGVLSNGPEKTQLPL